MKLPRSCHAIPCSPSGAKRSKRAGAGGRLASILRQELPEQADDPADHDFSVAAELSEMVGVFLLVADRLCLPGGLPWAVCLCVAPIVSMHAGDTPHDQDLSIAADGLP